MTRHARSAAQRREAIEKRFPTWVPRTLAGALDAACADFAERPFVVTEDGTWTYAQMRDWANRLAGGLAGLGVGPGDHVAVVLANYAEFVAVRYAIARLGAVTVPIYETSSAEQAFCTSSNTSSDYCTRRLRSSRRGNANPVRLLTVAGDRHRRPGDDTRRQPVDGGRPQPEASM